MTQLSFGWDVPWGWFTRPWLTWQCDKVFSMLTPDDFWVC